ncbi:MAG TPA: two-component regulator propeller domain-containing protein, partial [Chitinophagales bacterium]|nr:two-component regulator propeller domain-containing protein [Chitinophagales bacterium]
MKRFYPLLLLAAIVTSCNGQTATTPTGYPKIKSNETSRGNHNIPCSLKDKTGNLWFGTSGNGVYRYDSKTFVNYTDKDGLADNAVRCILEDKDGNIWFGTDAGVCRFNPAEANKPGSNAFTCYTVTGIGSGNFFLGKPVHRTAVWSMMQDNSGRIWIGTQEDGIFYHDPSAANGTSFTPALDNPALVNESKLRLHAVNSIVQDKTGAIWFATWFDGLVRYDGKRIESFKPNNEVWFASIFQDKDGVLWIGRRSKGLMRFDPTEKQSDGSPRFTNITQNGTLDSCSVDVLTQDRQGNLWLG